MILYTIIGISRANVGVEFGGLYYIRWYLAYRGDFRTCSIPISKELFISVYSPVFPVGQYIYVCVCVCVCVCVNNVIYAFIVSFPGVMHAANMSLCY